MSEIRVKVWKTPYCGFLHGKGMEDLSAYLQSALLGHFMDAGISSYFGTRKPAEILLVSTEPGSSVPWVVSLEIEVQDNESNRRNGGNGALLQRIKKELLSIANCHLGDGGPVTSDNVQVSLIFQNHQNVIVC